MKLRPPQTNYTVIGLISRKSYLLVIPTWWLPCGVSQLSSIVVRMCEHNVNISS